MLFVQDSTLRAAMQLRAVLRQLLRKAVAVPAQSLSEVVLRHLLPEAADLQFPWRPMSAVQHLATVVVAWQEVV